jgi:hypothetical protein
MTQKADRPIPLSALSARELRRRALEYRQMAGSATAAVVHTGLLRLAERFEALADTKEAELPNA